MYRLGFERTLSAELTKSLADLLDLERVHTRNRRLVVVRRRRREQQVAAEDLCKVSHVSYGDPQRQEKCSPGWHLCGPERR